MIQGFAITTRGSEKEVNDDKVVLGNLALSSGFVSSRFEEPFIAAVFDGVSQGGKGSEASNIAASLLLEHLYSTDCEAGMDDIKALLSDISAALVRFHRSSGASSRAATTVSGMAVGTGSRIIGFNSGDSRVYRYRSEMLVQMTVDHTVVQSLINSGADEFLIDRAETTDAHVITKALGLPSGNQEVADVEEFGDFVEGDIYLGCTDGLTGFISRDDIKRVLAAGVSLEVAGKTLVSMALHNGSYDNISLFLLTRNADSNQDVSSGLI